MRRKADHNQVGLGKRREKMNSPCIREASGEYLQGCFGLSEPQTPISMAIAAASNSRHVFEVDMASCMHPSPYFTNHESLPSLQESFSNFIKRFPQYLSTDEADKIRKEEYYHLTASNHVCLDYVGHGLFSYSQLQSCSQAAATASDSPFFDISYKFVGLHFRKQNGVEESRLENKMRERIMAFLNISEDDYTVIFTANQESAFKILADSYPFQSNQHLLTVYDHENDAVKLMIETSKKRGSRLMSAEFIWPNLSIQSEKLQKKIVSKRKRKRRNRGLFVFPLQSRITGTRYSYQWMNTAQENGWHVLLDACALGPKDMETLGLSLFKPDFLVCSFFKVYGESPSGFGCLFIKKSSTSVLKEPKISTGMPIVRLVLDKQPPEQLEESVDEAKLESHNNVFVRGSSSGLIACEDNNKRPKAPEIEESSQSGTSGNSLEFRGLNHADSLGLILISTRARYLTNWLVNALLSLRHPNSENGHFLVRIYGPKVNFDRAPAVAFNIFDWKGEKIDPTLIQKLASRYNISLGYGCLNHISFSKKSEENNEQMLEIKTREGERVFNGTISVVTAALGFLTNFEDIYRLWAFVSRFLDADFVEKERWRYTDLNLKIVEV